MTRLTYIIIILTLLSGAVGFSLTLLITGITPVPAIIQLLIYGGLLVLFWHECVDPLWGPWTRKAVAERKAKYEAWKAYQKTRDALAAAEAQAALQERIDTYDKAAVREHKAWQKEYFEKNIPKQSSE